MSSMYSLLSYKYYDSPEGQDVWKKVFVTSKYMAFTGTIVAFHDVNMYSKSKGFINSAARYAYHIGPLVGMATTFTVTTNALQNLRGKNDKWNYFWGGALSAGIYGAWQKNALGGMYLAVILGVAAVTKKMAIDEGWEFFKKPVQRTTSPWAYHLDWSMTKDLEGRHFTTNPQ